jgi:S-adenosylmethionine/arginine decarboxylase-like enzyme
VDAIEPTLGERMRAFGVVLHGSLASQRWIEFLHEVAFRIGMSAVSAPAVWNYPVGGKGGNGSTIMLPITESFLALDTWPDHRGSYLFVCSCKPFFGADIDTVAQEFGLTPSRERNGRFFRQLNLTGS